MATVTPTPIEVFTAGQLREVNYQGYENARNNYADMDAPYFMDLVVANVLNRVHWLTADKWWPEAVKVKRTDDGKDFEAYWNLHYKSFLHIKAVVDLGQLAKEVPNPKLLMIIDKIACQMMADGFDAPDLEIIWDGELDYLGKITAAVNLAPADWAWLGCYIENLESALLNTLEAEYDSRFGDEGFIAESAEQQWVYDRSGGIVNYDELPIELVEQLAKEVNQ